jgi:hypothetical protein
MQHKGFGKMACPIARSLIFGSGHKSRAAPWNAK